MDHGDLLEGLNDEQRAVLEHDFATAGPLLVLAGAGTGKTATLTRRLALELRRGAAPDQVTALTFTRKAATEMRERTARLLGEGAGVPDIRTFHALGLRLLSEGGGEGWRLAGWSGEPVLLDDAAASGFRAGFWADRFRRDPAPAVPARVLDLLQSEFGTPTRLEAARPDHPHLAAWTDWEAAKRRAGVAEFSDLVAGALVALETGGELLERWRRRAGTLLVDEYQDTDRTQYRLANLLAGDSPRLLAVGDDDQSIYGFRGADVRNVLDWARDRPDGRILSLVRNYRCLAPILEVSNRLFPDKPERFRKVLVAARAAEGGAAPVWRRCRDGAEEGRWLSAQIGARLRAGLPSRDACVLFRANREEAALRAGLRDLPQSEDGEGEGVRFLTIHAAKGLEWPLVAVAGQDAAEPEALLPADVDEERRLFYVACTRARDVLLLTSCRLRTLDGAEETRTVKPWMRLARPGLRVLPGWRERVLGAVSAQVRERGVREDALATT